MPAVIVENDTSVWADQTGAIYHYPKRYKSILKEGTEVLYYKGRIKDKSFTSKRLGSNPHYFGKARIGSVFEDENSSKGDLFAKIEDFVRFEFAVPAKLNGKYMEAIPPEKTQNYWRDGVRVISVSDYQTIVEYAGLPVSDLGLVTQNDSMDFWSAVEGSRTNFFGTRYERNAALRKQAIDVHGLACNACGFDFEVAYGAHAEGFIHVHHVVPISEFDGEKTVDPIQDMVTLCANCHAVVHRRRDLTLSLDELKSIVKVRWVLKV